MRRKFLIRGSIGLITLLCLGFAVVYIIAQRATAPVPLGVTNGRLAPCPPTPNCVSTYSTSPEHAMDSVPFSGDVDKTKDALLEVVNRYPRTTVLQNDSNYLHVLFRTPVMGFPDDVEFYLDEATQQIHFRSASRLGRGDLGVNRARMEQIRADLVVLQLRATCSPCYTLLRV